MDPLARQAVRNALEGNWEEAERINLLILKQQPQDLQATSRLARAEIELRKLSKAEKLYKKVLRLDKYNPIAQKALEKLKNLKRGGKATPLKPNNLFLEEPGKSKTVSLIHLGAGDVIANLATGDPVQLAPGIRRISIETLDKKYVGKIPDDISTRLIKLIKTGNKYQVSVRKAGAEEVQVFIMETERSPKTGNLPSFPLTDKRGYLSPNQESATQFTQDEEF